MTMQENHIDEWLNKAFQLAFFLHGNRETAKKIALSAMAKLETASNAQFKRYYYTPTGRAENTRATRSRVSLNDLQLLQRLVLVESENFEREQEKNENVCERKLLTYFIKHLVRISLKRNSFYVTLAVTRILHNYGTADAMEIYNVVVQDPERVHDDYYYRSRKGVLMKELKTRFGDLLDIVRGNRGEERFQTGKENADLTEIAKESLKFFTPWNSKCAIPEKFDPFDDVIKPFHFDKDDPDGEHRIEVNRIHAALHPGCFNRLTDALNLSASAEKMEIPKFMINEKNADLDNNDWRNPPSLEVDELETIKSALNAQAENRKAMSAGFLRVVVDGHEQTQINLNEASAVKFDLDESAELIEVRAQTADSGEIILATHLLNFEDLANGNQTQSVVLEGGQKVSFNFVPMIDEYGEVTSLNCGVNYAETAWLKRFALALRRAKFALGQTNWLLKPALTFGLVLLAVTFGWLIFRNSGENERIAIGPKQENQNGVIFIPKDLPKEENSNIEKEKEDKNIENKNAPKDSDNMNKTAPRQSETPDIRKQTPKRENKPEVLPEKEIPFQKQQNEQLATNTNKPRKDDVDNNGILKLPIRESNQKSIYKEGQGRPVKIKIEGKSLAEIKLLYIEITGDQILGKQISNQIVADIQKSGAFVITTDKETADAALKIYVRHESDADTREEASVAVVVRLVNAQGFVVYPNQKRVSGWKYVGTIAKLPSRIAEDLIKVKNAETRTK